MYENDLESRHAVEELLSLGFTPEELADLTPGETRLLALIDDKHLPDVPPNTDVASPREYAGRFMKKLARKREQEMVQFTLECRKDDCPDAILEVQEHRLRTSMEHRYLDSNDPHVDEPVHSQQALCITADDSSMTPRENDETTRNELRLRRYRRLTSIACGLQHRLKKYWEDE